MSLSTYSPKMLRLFSSLKETVSILAVDTDLGTLESYRRIFSAHLLYRIVTVSSAREAQSIIQSGIPLHLCVLDLGISDLNNDEFYLIREYSNRLPFVIISGTESAEKSFKARDIGAKEFISKPVDTQSILFWEKLSDTFLNHTIYPDISAGNPQMKKILQTICVKNSWNFSALANEANVSEAALRKIWYAHCAFAPMKVLFVYRLYKAAFRFHNCCQIEDNQQMKLNPNIIDNYTRRIEQYLQYRKLYDEIRDRKWHGGKNVTMGTKEKCLSS